MLGIVTKDEFAETLRAAARDEMRIDERDKEMNEMKMKHVGYSILPDYDPRYFI